MKSSRSGYSHRGYPNQKVDPITARILSANQKRRAIAGNQAGEIKKKNMQLYGKIFMNWVKLKLGGPVSNWRIRKPFTGRLAKVDGPNGESGRSFENYPE